MPETAQFGGFEENAGVSGALKPGTVLLARYKILGVVGGGGQGAVYQARDLSFPDVKRLVAIKEMHVNATDPNLRASTLKNFQREANILATMTHPAIARILEFFDQNERAYLIMEYINGSDLEQLLVKTKKLPMDKILEWSIDLCDVLHYLHNHEPDPIIFRDMKPSNIMIDSFGKLRLIDFGIAKAFEVGAKQTMIGTEGYSAPEQYKGNANPLSDIYSLGATLHHIITRRDPRLEPPFSFPERPITELNPETPTEFARIIEKALAFEPSSRFASCAEMKSALEALRYRPIASPMPSSPSIVQRSGESNPTPGQVPSSATGFFDDINDSLDGNIQPKWTFKTEDEIRSSPVVFQGIAYVGSYDTNLWAIRLTSGEFAWKKATEGGIASSPIVDPDNKQVLFGSDDTHYFAVSAKDGRSNWIYDTGGKVRGTGRLADGRVFFGSDDGRVYSVLLNNGRKNWEYDTGSPVRCTPAITSDRVIAGNEAGELFGLDIVDGQRKWSFRARKAILSSPFIDIEGVCYVGSMDNYLYALDASSGYSHWRYRTNGAIISSAYVDGNFIYIGSTDGKLYCINAQTGKEKWTFDAEKPVVSSPVVYDGTVYFGGTNGKVYAVDTKNGKPKWSYLTGASITSTPCIAAEEKLILIGSMDSKLYAFPLVN